MRRALTRVLLAEDFVPFRELICSILKKQDGLQIIAEVGDGQQAVKISEELKPDLILLDVGLPTLNGLAAARQICQLVPEAKIIFVTQESSPEVVQEAFNLGAQGYVFKIQIVSDLLPAIEAVLEGRRFVSAEQRYGRFLLLL
jgi:DNA-binding NarL/FixJ family response regulator